MFGPATIYETEQAGERIRVLNVGGVWQSATFLGERRFNLVFEYFRAFDAVFSCGLAVRHALMIGGGGCAWPKHAAVTHPDLSIDVVEADPAIVEIARKHFYAGELEKSPNQANAAKADTSADTASDCGSLRLFAADGRAFLEKTKAGSYDAVLVDVFSGASPVRSLATIEAARAAKRALRPGGVYLSNIVSRDSGRDISFLLDEMTTFSKEFDRVLVIPCSDARFSGEDNFLLVATCGPWSFDGALAFPESATGTVLFDED